MNFTRIVILISVSGLILLTAGCAGFHCRDQMPGPAPEHALERALGEIDQSIRDCLETGDYHGALRLLPKEAALWNELMTQTGKSYEGAHGFLHQSVMSRAAAFGDSQWGRVLDDPEIPYRYKTLLVFEILESRLGKGAVYWGNDDNLIVPIPRRVDFDGEERFQLPEGISGGTPDNQPNGAAREAPSLHNSAHHSSHREIIETKYDAPLERFEVIDWSPTTRVLWFDWQRRWWGTFNVIETTPAGDPQYWYDIPQPPTANSIERIRIVTMADQRFLEVIDRTHMGNGFLSLYEIRNGGVRLKLRARVTANLSVRFEPRMAEIRYRDSGEGKARVILQAECITQPRDGSEEQHVGRYYREFVLERGDFRELRDQRVGREELMD